MKKIITALISILIIGLAYIAFSDYDHDNDTIYYGGDIVTMNDAQKTVEAIYVKNGKIIEVGSKEAILKLKTSKTQVVDLQGKTLMPGFFDAHGHLDITSIFADMVDINGIKYRKAADVWQIVETNCRNGQKDEWLFFYGFDPVLTKGITTPSLRYLDSIAPDKPIVIMTKALHIFYANSKAFAMLGISDKTPDPSKASYYERDANGKLTGGIVEQEALEPIRLKIQESVKKTFIKNTETVMSRYAQWGVTSAVNMGMTATNKGLLTLYEHLSAEHAKPLSNLLQLVGKLPKRQPNPRLFLYLRKEFDSFLPPNVENGDDFFKIIGIKFWYDGSPYSGSMLLKKAYIRSNFTINDIHLTPNHTSESLLKPEELQGWIEKYQAKGWSVAIHSQGDRAGEEVIQVFEKLHQKQPINAFRHRMEHCMLLPKSSVAALQKMTISPSFHINHVLYYGEFLKSDILGDERASQIFPIKSVADAGIPYSLHGDMPQFYPNPLSLASTSVNRKTESGTLVNPTEVVSVWQALKSVTIDAAWQLHLENKLGSIEKGKYADLVILDKNPLTNPPETMASIKVLETIVAGNTVWKN